MSTREYHEKRTQAILRREIKRLNRICIAQCAGAVAVFVIVMTALLLIMGNPLKADAVSTSGISYKTSKAGAGYVTTIRINGKVAKVRTAKKLKVKVVKAEKLTVGKVTRRAGKYILVEKINGKCINKRGDGRTSDGYYISYKRVKGHRKGAKYTTYLIYADNNIEDDITTRIDKRTR